MKITNEESEDTGKYSRGAGFGYFFYNLFSFCTSSSFMTTSPSTRSLSSPVFNLTCPFTLLLPLKECGHSHSVSTVSAERLHGEMGDMTHLMHKTLKDMGDHQGTRRTVMGRAESGIQHKAALRTVVREMITCRMY